MFDPHSYSNMADNDFPESMEDLTARIDLEDEDYAYCYNKSEPILLESCDVMPVPGGKLKCLEDNCHFRTHRMKQLRQHLRSVHNFMIKTETLYFRCKDNFDGWLAAIESNRGHSYNQSSHSSENNGLGYYHCSLGKHFYDDPVSGRRKAVNQCTASLLVNGNCTSGNIYVDVIDHHYGHALPTMQDSLPSTRIKKFSRDEKNYLRQLISDGVSRKMLWEKMLEKTDGSMSEVDLKKNIDHHRFYEVYRKAELSYTEDADLSVWLKELNEDEKAGLVMHKASSPSEDIDPFGNAVIRTNCNKLRSLPASDFVLGLMSLKQQSLIMRFSKTIILERVAPVHGEPTEGKLIYHTFYIFIIDDSGRDIPVGLLMTTSCDMSVFNSFFLSIKERCGELTPDRLLYNDKEVEVEWLKVFNRKTPMCLFSPWYVQAQFAAIIRTGDVAITERHAKLLKEKFSNLIMKKNKQLFDQELQSFFQMLNSRKVTHGILDYVTKILLPSVQEWALYRLGDHRKEVTHCMTIFTEKHIAIFHKFSKRLIGRCFHLAIRQQRSKLSKGMIRKKAPGKKPNPYSMCLSLEKQPAPAPSSSGVMMDDCEFFDEMDCSVGAEVVVSAAQSNTAPQQDLASIVQMDLDGETFYFQKENGISVTQAPSLNVPIVAQESVESTSHTKTDSVQALKERLKTMISLIPSTADLGLSNSFDSLLASFDTFPTTDKNGKLVRPRSMDMFVAAAKKKTPPENDTVGNLKKSPIKKLSSSTITPHEQPNPSRRNLILKPKPRNGPITLSSAPRRENSQRLSTPLSRIPIDVGQPVKRTVRETRRHPITPPANAGNLTNISEHAYSTASHPRTLSQQRGPYSSFTTDGLVAIPNSTLTVGVKDLGVPLNLPRISLKKKLTSPKVVNGRTDASQLITEQVQQPGHIHGANNIIVTSAVSGTNMIPRTETVPVSNTASSEPASPPKHSKIISVTSVDQCAPIITVPMTTARGEAMTTAALGEHMRRVPIGTLIDVPASNVPVSSTVVGHKRTAATAFPSPPAGDAAPVDTIVWSDGVSLFVPETSVSTTDTSEPGTKVILLDFNSFSSVTVEPRNLSPDIPSIIDFSLIHA